MTDISVGSVSVSVVPDTRRFATDLKAKLKPAGEQAKTALSEQISQGVRDGLKDGFKQSIPTTQRKGRESGASFGGAFSREVKTKIEAALKSLPDANIGVATTEADQKLKDLRAEIASLASKDIGLDISDTDALAKIDDVKFQLDQLGAKSPSIQVRADTAAAIAQLGAVQAMVNKLDGSTAKVNVHERTSRSAEPAALSRLGGGMGLLPATILALGPALVPITGAVAALGGALATPLAAAGGGLTVGAIVAGAAAKQTKEQIKQIGELKKKVDSAKQSLATANAAAGASSGNSSAAASRSAANSLAAAQRTHAQSVASARAALANATTPSARASAQLRIQSANATLASRQASVQASLTARQASIAASADTRRAAAQLKVTQATQAYKAALAGLSPAQRKFMDSQAKLKGSFKNLIQTAGPVILGPISKGMNLLAKIMPNLAPLLSGVSGGIETLMKDLGKLASGPEFKAFMSNFGTAAGKAIVDFGRIFGNFGKGLYGIFSALSPLQGGFMSALGTMMQKFADWSSTLDRNKGFQSFLAYIRDVGPKVATTFGDLLRVVGKLGVALAPLGGVVLGAVDGLARFIITAKPSTLSAIGIAIGGIALALGKGPLGLAFALGATLSHSDRFLSFLKKAGKYVGDIADGFNKLPTWAKAAAGVAVGAGAVGLKLKGANSLTGGGKPGNLFGVLGKAKPIPVFVVNEGFGGGPDAVGGKKGWLKTLAAWSVPTTTAVATGVALEKGHPLSGMPPVTGWAAEKIGDIFGGADKSAERLNDQIRTMNQLLGLIPKPVSVEFRAPGLTREMQLVQQYGSWLDNLDGRTVKTFIKARLDHNAGQLDRFGHPEGVGATGGIVRRPTVALIGEAGPEAVVPLNRTAGNGPLPSGGVGGVSVHIDQVVAQDYRDFMTQMQRRSRTANGGGVNF